MTIRANKFDVPDVVMPQHVLLSVFDKTGLDTIVDAVLELNPDAHFYSTGGTGKRIVEILGGKAGKNYTPIEDHTAAPEMEGGLVKTLHPAVHGGLLAEAGNPAHATYLQDAVQRITGRPAVPFDMMVGNLYPFAKVIEGGANAEEARGYIDIGGPTLITAAAKNFHRVAVLTNPDQYDDVARSLKEGGGTSLWRRFNLANAALDMVAKDRTAVAAHFSSLNFHKDVLPTITVEE